jgi:hypothetical protein
MKFFTNFIPRKDLSFKYFHTSTKIYRNSNCINCIKTDKGIGLIVGRELENTLWIILTIFLLLQTPPFKGSLKAFLLPLLHRRETKLFVPFLQNAEIYQTIKQFKLTKAGGPDGMKNFFTNILAHSRRMKWFNLFRVFLIGGRMLREVNHTYITLSSLKLILHKGFNNLD